MLPLSIYNHKHVHTCIVALADKVIWEDVISQTHRHAGHVYNL